jgi:hypothetical protein
MSANCHGEVGAAMAEMAGQERNALFVFRLRCGGFGRNKDNLMTTFRRSNDTRGRNRF